jgi:hypothetical protein
VEEREVDSRARAGRPDEPGFLEGYGYHNHGDPWKEQRYWND